MKVLLTGANGYIGKRLINRLVEEGHEVICCVRDAKRFNPSAVVVPQISIIEVDLLEKESLTKIPLDIDGAYYLVHSMSSSSEYESLEKQCAVNFREAMNKTKVKQVLYLSGIVNETELSKHLSSRKNVENELGKGSFKLTTLRAGIIIGSGSASFEIIRDLVEKLPIMITPKWLNTKCQPIGIKDVIEFLVAALFQEKTYGRNFDIGGPDILNYKEMLLGFAKERNLKRKIWTVPVMTPKLSSYWLYFVTSTSYKLASSLVNSMKVEVICRDSRINEILNVQPISYQASLELAFARIKNNAVLSSWKDAYASSGFNDTISDFIEVPTFGCFRDVRINEVSDKQNTINRIWRIGGNTGWYAGNWLWKIRGYMDKIVGGVGLRRGRTNPDSIQAGDALDFWRVLYANKEEGRLLLFAEMKLPGEAWLEFKIHRDKLVQIATFRPLGLAGRLYWFAVFPFHGYIFKGMIKGITKNNPQKKEQS